MVLSMDRWKGKVAIVTGASVGCGASITTQLVEHGLLVVGLARRKEKMQELAESLRKKPGKLFAFQADITKEDEILEAFKWTVKNVGPIHILVNNAGISTTSTLIEGCAKEWRKVFDTNVMALAIATKEAVQNMKENNVDGHIIHINSVLGHYVAHVPEMNVYPASKYAVTALTETLRQELNAINSRIKVTCKSRSGDTEFFERAIHGKNEQNHDDFNNFVETVPKLQGEDIADAVIYVLSTPPHVQVHELMIRPLGERV